MSETAPQIAASGRIPPAPVRYAQALALKLGRPAWPRGDGGDGPWPLVRVDEFPHARAFDPGGALGTDAYRRFHAVLAEAGVPYLLAVPPRVSRDYLDPTGTESRPLAESEAALLRELADQGVTFGLHGLDHRTRHASPRRHSELCGLSPQAAALRLDGAREALAALGLETPVFVPPFNRFDAAQYAAIAERFAVVCGGPESVRLLGFHPTPVRLGAAVYLPSYRPLYGRAAEVAPALLALLESGRSPWAPITLHWGWELEDGFAGLRRLCAALAGCPAQPWSNLIAAS